MDDFFLISVAARMLGMHPQTLRKYDRLGLIQPSRTIGSMRVYSQDEIGRLRAIKRLVDDAGINLAGLRQRMRISPKMAGCTYWRFRRICGASSAALLDMKSCFKIPASLLFLLVRLILSSSTGWFQNGYRRKRWPR